MAGEAEGDAGAEAEAEVGIVSQKPADCHVKEDRRSEATERASSAGEKLFPITLLQRIREVTKSWGRGFFFFFFYFFCYFFVGFIYFFLFETVLEILYWL